MRLVAASLLFAALGCGGANASSIMVIGEAPAATPSIEVIGAAPAKVSSIETRGAAPVASVSVLALGEPLPDVAMEKVAAIPQQSPHSRHSNTMPMVIRGGLVGDSAPAAETASVPNAPAPAATSESSEAAADSTPPPKRRKTPPRPRQPDIVKPPEEENATPLPATQ